MPSDIWAINTNMYKTNKRAYSINLRGDYQKLDFEFENNTQVFYSCSLQWKNQYYVFGGDFIEGDPTQISMVNGNRLERKGTLDFDFIFGGCTVLNKQTVVLCFGSRTEHDLCLQSNNPLGTFTKLPKSKYRHLYTRIASFDGKNKSVHKNLNLTL